MTTVSSLLSNEITGLLKDSKTNIFKQGEVANFIIELSNFVVNRFSPVLRRENYMIFAHPFGM